MALKIQAVLFLFPLLIFILLKCSNSVPIAIYWGQGTDEDEGSLQDTCSTGNYEIVIIAFLNTFGNGRTLGLNLQHCDSSSGGCTSLSAEISACQKAGYKVLLSLGGAEGDYSLSSTDAAKQLALELWNNFLGGQSDSRPLGDAVLDGIDFDVEHGGNQFWDDLATALHAYNNGESKVILSAAPGCYLPDPNLNAAINTGLFTYVWPQFYDSPPPGGCQYDGGSADRLLDAWNRWASFPVNQLFLGLPAAPEGTTTGGFVPPEVLKSQILPVIKGSAKFGGVMLWSKKLDNGYSNAIKNS